MKAMPNSAGNRPRPWPTGNKLSQPNLIEYDGPEEGWALLNIEGKKLNPRILTAAAFAYWICRHEYGRFIENLDQLASDRLIKIALSKKR